MILLKIVAGKDVVVSLFYLKIGESTSSAYQLVVQMLFWNHWSMKDRPGVFTSTTRSHARHAARSPALVRTWMDQSETL